MPLQAIKVTIQHVERGVICEQYPHVVGQDYTIGTETDLPNSISRQCVTVINYTPSVGNRRHMRCLAKLLALFRANVPMSDVETALDALSP